MIQSEKMLWWIDLMLYSVYTIEQVSGHLKTPLSIVYLSPSRCVIFKYL